MTTVDLTRAACHEHPNRDLIWFPNDWYGPDEAKRICRTCPELATCREWILAFEKRNGHIEHGIWGGLTEYHRDRIRRGKTLGKPRPPMPANCVECGIGLVPNGREIPDGMRRHDARGKCRVCYARERRVQAREAS